jgi:hypothetical protein
VRSRAGCPKAYIIVDMEWFSVARPLYHYIAEQDVYPQISTS